MSGIRISEKYGVNPSLGVCFWCGKDNGTVLLLGKLPGDREAPHRMATDYEPCEQCTKEMALGITLFQMSDVPLHDNQRPMHKDPDGYPTGTWCVVKEELIERTVTAPELKEAVLRHRKAFISIRDWKEMGLEAATKSKEVPDGDKS